jgi:hypothetical protein
MEAGRSTAARAALAGRSAGAAEMPVRTAAPFKKALRSIDFSAAEAFGDFLLPPLTMDLIFFMGVPPGRKYR